MEADFYSWIDDLFSRGAHGYVFFVIDRRTFSGCGVHTVRSAFFFDVDRRAFFIRCDCLSDIFLHGSTAFFHLQGFIESSFFASCGSKDSFSFGVIGM